MTLLHLRDMVDKGGFALRIVSEMLNPRNRQLAEVTRVDDCIVSNTVISLLTSQVFENRELSTVFADLFDHDGAEISLQPASDYVVTGRPLTFYTVVEAARRRGEVAIGYRLLAHAGNAGRRYGVVVNPAKADPITFAEADWVIVLAER